MEELGRVLFWLSTVAFASFTLCPNETRTRFGLLAMHCNLVLARPVIQWMGVYLYRCGRCLPPSICYAQSTLPVGLKKVLTRRIHY